MKEARTIENVMNERHATIVIKRVADTKIEWEMVIYRNREKGYPSIPDCIRSLEIKLEVNDCDGYTCFI